MVFYGISRISMQLIAAVTAITMLISVVPIGVLSVLAADILTGPSDFDVDNTAEFTTATIDASAYENLILSFDYDAELLDGIAGSTGGTPDSFTYGWRTGGGDNDLATINGIPEPGVAGDETGFVSVTLPVGAQVADLVIYISVDANASGGTDDVQITNFMLEGDPAAPVCIPQHDVVGPTDIANTDTGEYFDSIQDAIDDCDTEDSHTIQLSADITTTEQVTINKEIILDGDGYTLFANFTKTSNSNNAAIGIIGTDDATVKNIVLDGSSGTDLHGLNIYESTAITVDNVSSNNFRSGMVVNGSTVDASDFSTSGNIWHGINVSPGSGVTDDSILNISATSLHDETLVPHIFIDDVTVTPIIEVNDLDDQYATSSFGDALVYTLKQPVPKKVDICHWNGQTFSFLNVSVNSIGNAHGAQGVNDGDIIPVIPGVYPGQNLDMTYGSMTGAEVLENECVIEDDEPDQCISLNLLTNGSFEEEEVTNSKLWQKFAAVTGWIVERVSNGASTTLEIHRGWSGNQAADGEQYVELDGDHSTQVEQIVTTEAGGLYELSWAFAPRHNITADQNQLSVLVDGVEVATEGPATGAAGLTPSDWTRNSYQFVADDTNTKIAFADAGPSNSFGTLLDDAQLCLVKEPEPAEECHLPYIVEFGLDSDDNTYSTSTGTGLVIEEIPGGYTIGLYDDGRAGVYEVQGTITFPAGTDTATFSFTEAAGNEGLEQTHATYPDVADLTGNTIEFALAVNGANDIFTITDAALENAANCDIEFPEPELPSTVTMCKYDEQDNPLSGWQLSLLGEEVDSLAFAPTAATQSMTDIDAGEYVLKADGAYEYRGSSGLLADARFSERQAGDPGFGTYPYNPWRTTNPATGGLSVSVNGDDGALWGSVFSPAHIYYGSFTQASFGDIDFTLYDNAYGDNVGTIDLTLYEGFTGVTGDNGCVVFEEVPYGEYEVAELLQPGFENISGLGPVVVDEASETFDVINDDLSVAPQCELMVVSDDETVIVENNDYATSTYEHPNWSADIPGANWIWETYRVVDTSVDTVRTFEESFTVATPTSAVLDIAADNSYLVYINDVLVIDRSTYENNFQSHTQKTYTTEVLDALVSGENTMRIEVTNKGVPGSNDRSNPAGVLYKLVVNGTPECEVTTEVTEDEDYLIEGYKWHDENYNGVWDEGEVGIAGWTIYLESEATTTSTTTDATGYYSFEVPEGYYEVYEEMRDGWVQTAPVMSYIDTISFVTDDLYYSYGGSCTYIFGQELYKSLSLGPINPEFCEFGNYEILYDVSGYKYESTNDSAIGLAGWTIEITNGTTTMSTTTDSTGAYSFEVPYGTWTISEVLQSGWEQVAVVGSEGDLSEDGETCSYAFGISEEEIDSATCDFYNQEVNDSSTSQGGSRSSGSRTAGGPTPQVLGASTADMCPYLVDYMQIGQDNDPFEVIKLQLFLSMIMGYDNPITGVFGTITDANVKLFQTRYSDEVLKPWFDAGIVPHMDPTGFVYKTTLWKINDLVCPGTPFPSLEGETLQFNVDR